MSQALMSASLMGLPRPGASAKAAPAPRPATRRTAADSGLRIDMFDLPVAVDAPAGEAVVVLIGEPEHVLDRGLGLPARRHEVGPQRLGIAGFVPGTALQHYRLAVPSPGHPKAGERLGIDRPLQGRFGPAPAAVGRDHDLGNTAGAGIGDAGNLVIALVLQRVAERGVG